MGCVQPVQVEFYLWLDMFLHNYASGKYAEANDSIEGLRRPTKALVNSDDSEDSDGAEGTSSNTDVDARQRCISSFADAIGEYFSRGAADTALPDACTSAPTADSWAVRSSPGSGRTTFAIRDIMFGEEVMVQRPLSVLLTPDSNATALVCSECFLVVSSLAEEWGRLPFEGRTRLPSLCVEGTHSMQEVRNCPCGDRCSAVFCSTHCEERALRGWHGLLCPSRLDPEQVKAYEAIVSISEIWENPHILQAVRLTADLLVSIQKAAGVEGSTKCSGTSDFDVDSLCSELWEDGACDSCGRDAREQAMTDLATHVQILFGSFRDAMPESRTAMQQLLGPHALSRRIGMLELVCIRVDLDSPLTSMLAQHDESAGGASIGVCPLTSFAATETGQQMEQAVSASALDSFVAFCNHSCIPNVDVNFRHDAARPGLWCVATASRAIEEGEELTIQYVPVVTIPVADRQASLQRWGFECSCIRCVAEGRLSANDADWFCKGCAELEMDSASDADADSYPSADELRGCKNAVSEYC